MKYIGVLLFGWLLGVSLGLRAQDVRYVDDFQLRLNFLMPSLELEVADGATKTINIRAGLSVDLGGQKTENSTAYKISLNPFANAQYRWYYNVKSRSKMGKLFAGNSANFLAFVVEGSANSITKNAEFSTAGFGVGVLWGLQRNYSSGFSLGLEGGFGFGTNYLRQTDVILMGGFRVGYLLYAAKESHDELDTH